MNALAISIARGSICFDLALNFAPIIPRRGVTQHHRHTRSHELPVLIVLLQDPALVEGVIEVFAAAPRRFVFIIARSPA